MQIYLQFAERKYIGRSQIYLEEWAQMQIYLQFAERK
jgi:hypothetical protein